MNKGLIKALIMPVLMAIASLGVCVTGTFAMFTEQAEVQIQVNAGRINFDVVPTISNAIFNNGGSATIIDSKPVIAGATSGDSVTLTLTGDNKSNVNVKYRGYIHVANQAWVDCINVTSTNFASTWSSVLLPDADPAVSTIGLSFSGDIHGLPTEALTISVGYEVVQGNADIGNADSHVGFMTYDSNSEKFQYLAKDFVNNIKVTGTYASSADKILTTEVLTDLNADNDDAYYVYNGNARVAGYLIDAPTGGTNLRASIPCAQSTYTIKKGNADVPANKSGGYATFAL